MSDFIAFRHKSNGVVAYYPEHYADHPVFGDDLEVYDPEGYEEDKVTFDNHELPVDQRVQFVAIPLADMTKDELIKFAESHGLDTSGNKADLIERLSAPDKEES